MENFKNFGVDTEFGDLCSSVENIFDKYRDIYSGQKGDAIIDQQFVKHIEEILDAIKREGFVPQFTPFVPLFVKYREEILDAIKREGLTLAKDNVLFKNYSLMSTLTSCTANDLGICLEAFLKENENDYDYYKLRVENVYPEIYIVETFDMYDIIYRVLPESYKAKSIDDIILETVNLSIGAFSDYSRNIRFDTDIKSLKEW